MYKSVSSGFQHVKWNDCLFPRRTVDKNRERFSGETVVNGFSTCKNYVNLYLLPEKSVFVKALARFIKLFTNGPPS